MKIWLLVLLAVATSVCTWLSTAPFDSSLAAIAAPMLLIVIAIRSNATSVAMLCIFFAQIPLWLFVHRWVASIAFLGWLGVGVYMSIWAPLFVCLLRRVLGSERCAKLSIVIVAPIMWVALECLRGIVIFDGYPWYLAGSGILDWPAVHVASIGSVWSASFLVVACAAAIATPTTISKKTWFMLGFVAIVLTIVGISQSVHRGTQLPVAVVQTNVRQSNKVAWTWEQQQIDVALAIQMTYEAVKDAETRPKLIVWPETMLPGSGFDVSRFDFAPWDDLFTPFWYWPQRINLLSAELGIPILVGSQTWLDIDVIEETDHVRVSPETQFNSAVMVFPDGHTQRYDKTFLTPFGERMPYVEKWPAFQEWVRERVGAAMLFDLDQGDERARFTLEGTFNGDTQGHVTIGTPICFEDTVPKVVRDLVWKDGERQVELLINLSNDGWFGDADDARLQHIREARMRCIENQTPMIRVANTGLSCLISSRGTVVQYASFEGEKAFRQQALMFSLAFEGNTRPLSVFFGDSIAWASLIACILLIIGSCKNRSKVHEEHPT